MDSEIQFIPGDSLDHWRIYRSLPLVARHGNTLLLNESGISVLMADGKLLSVEPPLGHEIILGGDGSFYSLIFNDGGIVIDCYDYNGCEFERVCSTLLPSGGVGSQEIVALSTIDGIEFWRDSGVECRRVARISRGSVLDGELVVASRPQGNLVASSPNMLAFSEDLGVRGRFLNLLDIGRGSILRVPASIEVAALGDLVVPFSWIDDLEVPCFGIKFFSRDSVERLDLEGPVLQMGGDQNRLVLTVLVGNDVHLREVTRAGDRGLHTRQIEMGSGYKSLSPDGALCLVSGHSDAVRVLRTSLDRHEVARSRGDLQLSVFGFCERSVVTRAPGRALGTLVHFHGGPESFEVPEPRLFGLPQWCLRHGIDWRGVNYQGSLMSDMAWTGSAWHRWREAALEDFSDALRYARGPIVLTGWSFGAALALALGGLEERVRGLLLGAAPGSLVRHVQRACTVDPWHGEWFARRFDLMGDDARFFNGVSAFREDLSVLEIHGSEDENCPEDLTTEIARQWELLGNPWKRLWLPGRGHYASCLEDVELITAATRGFLSEVFGFPDS